MADAFARTERLFAVSGLAGGALGVLNTPLVVLASIRSYQERGGGEAPDAPQVLAPLLTFADASVVYAAYGRLWAPILLLFLLGAAALYLRLEPRLGRPGRNAFSVLFTGLLMVLLGVVFVYWLGPDVLGDKVWGASFLVLTVFGLGVYSVGSTWLGIRLLRTRVAPGWVGWAFAAAPIGFLLAPILPNAPAAELFVYAVAWILAGIFMLRTPRSAGDFEQESSSA